MGGGSLLVLPFQNKAPSVVIQEGDPPIGKVRGALGVGTGPTPPLQDQSPEKPKTLEREQHQPGAPTSEFHGPSSPEKMLVERMQPESSESLDCIIKRGRCQNHNIEARKIVTKSRKWGKVKTGYGWIYSKHVRYSCRQQIIARIDTRNFPSGNFIIPDNLAIVGRLNNNNKMFDFNLSENTGLYAENKTKT